MIQRKEDWLTLLTMVRRDRSMALYLITPKDSQELYCINKHLAKAIENFKEIANRFLEMEDEETAKDYLGKSKVYEDLLIMFNTQKGGN